MNFLKSSVSGKIWLAALGAAVAGPLLLTIADSTAILAGGLFGYVFLLQYQSFQKQEMQKKQIAQENCIMISKIVPHIPRAIVIQNKR